MIRDLTRGGLAAGALFVLIACGAAPPPASLTMGAPARHGQAESETAAALPSEAARPTAPASGIRIDGDGYTYRAPNGWLDISKKMRRTGQEVDTGVGEEPSQGTTVRENFNVAVSSITGITLDTYEQMVPKRLAYMVDDLEIYDRVDIDGLETVHVGGEANTGDVSFVFEQFAVVRNGTMYTVSFALDSGRSAAERQDLIDSVLESWEWHT